MTPEEARDELIQGKGTQFDSEVVDVFLSLFTDLHIMEQEMHALCGEKTFFSGQEREESQ